MTHPQGHLLPDTISADMAWNAYDFLTINTDWRIVLTHRMPLTFDIEHDDHFAFFLADDTSWKTRDQATHRIACRIAELVRTSFNKTSIRRLHLQLPGEGADMTTFLSGLKDRVVVAMQMELQRHFNRSIKHWETEAISHWGRMSCSLDQQRFRAFVGLDQVVSQDAMRKALKFAFQRTGWSVMEQGARPHLQHNWQSEKLRVLRCPMDEEWRARALAVRAVETLFEAYLARLETETGVPALTQFAIRDRLDTRFEEDGVWGIIEIVLERDRRLFRLTPPDMSDLMTAHLITQQERRLLSAR